MGRDCLHLYLTFINLIENQVQMTWTKLASRSNILECDYKLSPIGRTSNELPNLLPLGLAAHQI